jgi:ParB family chromosome partitioning protein
MIEREITLVPLSKLGHGDLIGIDSRSGEAPPVDADTERLAADILSRGLLQPLGVYDNGAGLFVAYGNRRLDALQHLAKAGSIPRDQKIPVVMLEGTPADALAASISENDNRQDLHPVAQFENMARLLTLGWGVKQLGKAFGIGPVAVQRILALGGLHPSVREAWRADKIGEEAARAFTMAPEAAQAAALGRVLADHPYSQPNAFAVRKALFGDQSGASGLLKYVGEDAYAEAGGALIADLFSNSQAVGDIDLLQRLANEKLSARVEALKAEGWGTVHTVQPPGWYSYERVGEIVLNKDEAKARDAAKADKDTTRGWQEQVRIETTARLRGLDAEARATCHALVTVGADGVERVEAGFRPPSRLAPASDGLPDVEGAPKAATAYAYEAQTMALASLVEADGLAALRLCVAGLIGALGKGSPVHIQTHGWPGLRHEGAPDGYVRGPYGEGYITPVAAWLRICRADRADLLCWLDAAMFGAIDATVQARANGVNDQVIATTLTDLELRRESYTETALKAFDLAAYLGMLKKGQMAEIVREAGKPDVADTIPGMKKDEAVDAAHDALRGTGWLPACIRLEVLP